MSTLGQSINISKSLNSTAVQVISQWIGSANVLRNQKINEFKQKLKNKQKPNQSYAHIRKNEDFSFLKDVPVHRDGKAWVDVNPSNTSKIHHLCGSINTGRPKQAVLVCKDCKRH